jgi:hypothetical protein
LLVSNGGREALMEAQRFPDDYEGILAGAAQISATNLLTARYNRRRPVRNQADGVDVPVILAALGWHQRSNAASEQ